MPVLTLSEGPREAFAAVERILSSFLGEDGYALGGGAALTARWRHRHSSDVDLFVSEAVFAARIEQNTDRLIDVFEKDLSTRLLQISPTSVMLMSQEAEISLVVSRTLTRDPLSGDTVQGSRVVVETTAEILAKKLRYRMAQHGLYVARDLYDLAVARERSPAALAVALDVLGEEDRLRLAAALRHLPEELKIARERVEVVRPSYPELARAPAPVVVEILEAGPRALRRSVSRGTKP